MSKPLWTLNADVAMAIPADDEDEAREIAERFIEEAAAHDPRVRAAHVADFICGPEQDEEGTDAQLG